MNVWLATASDGTVGLDLVSKLMVELGTPTEGQRQIQFYQRSGFVAAGARRCWMPRASSTGGLSGSCEPAPSLAADARGTDCIGLGSEPRSWYDRDKLP
jgi:hypothetical protein